MALKTDSVLQELVQGNHTPKCKINKSLLFFKCIDDCAVFGRHILLLCKSKHKWLIDVFKMILKEIRFAVIIHNVGIILSIFNE